MQGICRSGVLIALVFSLAGSDCRDSAAKRRIRGSTHHRLDAARAHLLERAGQHAEAIHYYRQAAQRTISTPEQNYLLLHAARLSDSLKQQTSFGGSKFS